jgi:hypothetical protein
MTGTVTHITGYLGDADQAAVWRFVEAASRLGYFTQVLPIRRQPDGRVIAVAFLSDDPDDRGEQRMDAAVAKLSGVLPRDVTIVAAWKPEPGRAHPRVGWLIRGGGQAIIGEVLREEDCPPQPGRVLEIGS